MARSDKKKKASMKTLDLGELEKAGFVMLKDSTWADIADRLPTLLPSLDATIGGGLPFGRFIEVYAKNGIGKSNLMLGVTKSCTQLGIPVIWFDVEGTADKEHLAEMGIDTSKVIVRQPDKDDPGALSIEAIGESMETLIAFFKARDLPAVIIWDSIGQSIAGKTIEADFDNQQPGVKAKALTNLFAKIMPQLSLTKSMLIGVNQARELIGVYGQPAGAIESGGGNALHHAASLRLELKKGGGRLSRTIKGEKVYQGHPVKATVQKSKVSRLMGVSVNMLYGAQGFNEFMNIVYKGEELGFIKKSGQNYKYTSVSTGEIIEMNMWDFLEWSRTEEAFPVMREIFQQIILYYFPVKYPPLENETLDISDMPLMAGLGEIYASIAKAKGEADKEEEKPKKKTPKAKKED